MPGRHSVARTRERRGIPGRRWIVIGAVTVVAAGLGVYGAKTVLASGCDDVTDYRLAADPSIAPAVRAVLDRTAEEDLGCASIDVTDAPSAVQAGALAKPDGVPSLWLPESSLWVTKAGRTTGTLLDVASPSVAASPAVVATRSQDAPFLDSWLSVLRVPGQRIGDPMSDGAAIAPIAAVLAEVEQGKGQAGALSEALVPIAQAQAAAAADSSDAERLAAVRRDGGSAVVTEREFVMDEGGEGLAATVPQTGSFVLDYPLVVTEPAGPRHAAAEQVGARLAAALAGGADALTAQGLRTPDLAPLDGRGAGDVAALRVTDQAQLDNTLKQYTAVAKPIRALAVVDVSGSMNYAAGAGTRMDLTTQAGETGLRLFPDNAQFGMWVFSTDKGGPGQDWRELVPIRRMTDQVDGRTQRQLLLESNAEVGSLVGGGTGLYDSALAAWRRVKLNYDPRAVNSVILVTDGTNEDSNSISLNKLLDTLRAEQDPAKPVIIVTIGITESADAAVLQQISTATGGTSHIARNPAEIPNVFVNALRARQGG